MPCNAIATVSAQIKQDLSELLAQEPKALDAIEALLAQLTDQDVRRLSSSRTGARFAAGGSSIAINFTTGQVSVTGGWDRERNAALAQQITDGLTTIAGALLQQQARAAIAARYDVAEEQRATNGALVLTVDL